MYCPFNNYQIIANLLTLTITSFSDDQYQAFVVPIGSKVKHCPPKSIHHHYHELLYNIITFNTFGQILILMISVYLSSIQQQEKKNSITTTT